MNLINRNFTSTINQKATQFYFTLLAGLSGILVLPMTTKAADSLIGTLESPVEVKLGNTNVDPNNPDVVVASTIDWLLNIAFGVAVLLVLANLIFGAYQWIMSGGKSDKIAAGRNRMIWAIVGLVTVAAAYGITVAIKTILTGNGDISVDFSSN